VGGGTGGGRGGSPRPRGPAGGGAAGALRGPLRRRGRGGAGAAAAGAHLRTWPRLNCEKSVERTSKEERGPAFSEASAAASASPPSLDAGMKLFTLSKIEDMPRNCGRRGIAPASSARGRGVGAPGGRESRRPPPRPPARGCGAGGASLRHQVPPGVRPGGATRRAGPDAPLTTGPSSWAAPPAVPPSAPPPRFRDQRRVSAPEAARTDMTRTIAPARGALRLRRRGKLFPHLACRQLTLVLPSSGPRGCAAVRNQELPRARVARETCVAGSAGGAEETLEGAPWPPCHGSHLRPRPQVIAPSECGACAGPSGRRNAAIARTSIFTTLSAAALKRGRVTRPLAFW